jgi:hypothetical protein
MPQETGTPALSIVAAMVNGERTLDTWLAAVAPQIASGGIQTIVVSCESDARSTATPSPVDWITVRDRTLVPTMWSEGLQRARGAVVAFTITSCVPANDWVSAILTAHAEPHAAIGGVIDQAPNSAVADRALHLVRYTPYLPPQTAHRVGEIAGDNGTYKRAALTPFIATIAARGFWEADINRELRNKGDVLLIDPRIRVSHTSSYSTAGFSRQRFLHGRIFGRTRRASMSAPARLLRAMLAPIVPALMIVRSVRSVADRGRLDAGTLTAVPHAIWFLNCWAWGEAAGLLGV